MTQFLSRDNAMSASASYADASSACAAASHENTVILMMDAILMASIIIFALGRIGIFLLVLVCLVLLSILVLRGQVNTPGVWAR